MPLTARRAATSEGFVLNLPPALLVTRGTVAIEYYYSLTALDPV